jgi:hypothetical protein
MCTGTKNAGRTCTSQKNAGRTCTWCSPELKPFTWTKVSGGIRCWEQVNYDRDESMTSMIPRAQWQCLKCGEHGAISTPKHPLGGFDGNLKLQPRTAEHKDVLEMAREAFHAAAGLPIEWPCCIAFLAAHCEIAEMMGAADATAACEACVGRKKKPFITDGSLWNNWNLNIIQQNITIDREKINNLRCIVEYCMESNNFEQGVVIVVSTVNNT